MRRTKRFQEGKFVVLKYFGLGVLRQWCFSSFKTYHQRFVEKYHANASSIVYPLISW